MTVNSWDGILIPVNHLYNSRLLLYRTKVFHPDTKIYFFINNL